MLTMTLKATIVAKRCLPSILAILVDLELVTRGAVDYLQDIQVSRPVCLPPLSATLPSGIRRDITFRRTLQLIHVLKTHIINIFHINTISNKYK